MIGGKRQTWYLGSFAANVISNFYVTQLDPYTNTTTQFDSAVVYSPTVDSQGLVYIAGTGTPTGTVIPNFTYGGAVLKVNALGYYSSGIVSNLLINTDGNAITTFNSISSTPADVIYAGGTGNLVTGGLSTPTENLSEVTRLSTSLGQNWQRSLSNVESISVAGLRTNYVAWRGYFNKSGSTTGIAYGSFDFSGSTVFSKTITANSNDSSATAWDVDADGNYVLAGLFNGSLPFLCKTDSSGTLLWQYYITGGYTAGTDSITELATDASLNIYIVFNDGVVQKYNSSGTLQWTRYIDVTYDAGVFTEAKLTTTGIACDSTGNVYINGQAYYGTIASPPGFNQCGYVVKLDSAGALIFSNGLDFNPDYSLTQPISMIMSESQFYGNAMMFAVSVQKRFAPSSPSTYGTAEYIMSLPINGTLTNTYTFGSNTVTYAAWSNITSVSNSSYQTTTSANLNNSSYTGTIGSPANQTFSNLTPISDTIFLGNVMPAPPVPIAIEYLAVAGGGGTPARIGGGGGGGGVLTGTYASVAASTVITVTVGAGGLGRYGSADPQAGTVGGNTTIVGSGLTTVTAIGGGAGGQVNGLTYIYPDTGGSGGGGSTAENGMSGAGAAGTAGQGNAGGTGYAAPVYGGGGGGGAGAVGGNSPTSGTAAATGGDGVASSITGSSVYYGGGGGSSIYAGGSGTGGAGGLGGGGAGGNTFGSGTNGTANTGGGGGATGGGDFTPGAKGGDGGSGVGILRLLTSQYTGTVTGSPTVTTSGSYTVITFTGTGTYTA
jgi:hypothetical protein